MQMPVHDLNHEIVIGRVVLIPPVSIPDDLVVKAGVSEDVYHISFCYSKACLHKTR